MNTGTVAAGILFAVAILGYFNLKSNGPRLIGHLWTWVRAPRRQLAKQASQIEQLQEVVETQRQAHNANVDTVREAHDNLNALAGQLAQVTQRQVSCNARTTRK
jgi:hypothetical protein